MAAKLNPTPSEEFIIKYDRAEHSIDANTLINSLLHLTTVMQEIGKSLQPEQELKINVKANEPGSFLVLLELHHVLDVASSLWHEYGEIIKNSATILGILNGLIQLKKHLGGKQPKEIQVSQEATTIINADNLTITIEQPIYALYSQNPLIDKALSKHFETLEEDKSVSGFELLTPDHEPVLSIPREEFSPLASEVEQVDKESKTIVSERVSVSITKLLWDQNKKWDFIYAGNRISGKTTDPFFNDKIDKSEIRFAKGDRLVVNLKIKQVWDEEFHAWVNKSYEVADVLEFYKAPTQEKLDFGRPV